MADKKTITIPTSVIKRAAEALGLVERKRLGTPRAERNRKAIEFARRQREAAEAARRSYRNPLGSQTTSLPGVDISGVGVRPRYGSFDPLEHLGIDLPPRPLLLPMPDRNMYLQPFIEAEKRAHEAHAAATPVIEQTYADLNTALQNRMNEAEQRTAQQQAALAGIFDGLTGAADAQADQSMGALASQLGGYATPAVTAGVQDFVRAQEAAAATSQASHQAALQQFANAQAESMGQRQQDADAAKANSLARAASNLQSILDAIGLKKVDAERQYMADAAEVQRANEKAQRDYDMLVWQLRQNAAEEVRNQRQAALEEEMSMADMFERSKLPGRDVIELNAEQLMREDPESFNTFRNIISQVSGTGPMAMLEAMDLLQSGWEEYVQRAESEGAKPADRRKVEQWIREYFDERPRYVDPRVEGRLSATYRSLLRGY